MSRKYEIQLNTLIRAGTHVITIVSYEWLRAQACLHDICDERRIPFYIWSSCFGLSKFNEKGEKENISEELTDPIALLQTYYSEDFKEGLLLLEDFHPYIEPHNFQVIRWLREFTRISQDVNKFIILLSPAICIPRELEKDVPLIDMPLPDTDVIRDVLEMVADQYELREDYGDVEFHPALLESALGLTTMEAQRAFSKAAVEEKKITLNEIPMIINEKEEIIKKGQLLEYFHPEFDFGSVGGMDDLKEWLKKRGKGFGEKARNFGLVAPRGVLLLGVQGCGKSLTAKAIANEWKLPLLRFDLGRVFGGIVGQSEANIRNALKISEALAPCILWIDEIEKGISGVGSSDMTDGGTTSRVFGTLLTWMQEKGKPVFVIATANDISKLPAELLRKGRFDEIFFVDLPSSGERKIIFEIHIRKKERDGKPRNPLKFNLDYFSEETQGYTGAEIEEIVNEALYVAFNDGEREVKDADFIEAIKDIVPLSSTMKEEIQDLRKWALVRTRAASSHEPESLAKKSVDIPKLKQEQRNIFMRSKKDKD